MPSVKALVSSVCNVLTQRAAFCCLQSAKHINSCSLTVSLSHAVLSLPSGHVYQVIPALHKKIIGQILGPSQLLQGWSQLKVSLDRFSAQIILWCEVFADIGLRLSPSAKAAHNATQVSLLFPSWPSCHFQAERPHRLHSDGSVGLKKCGQVHCWHVAVPTLLTTDGHLKKLPWSIIRKINDQLSI